MLAIFSLGDLMDPLGMEPVGRHHLGFRIGPGFHHARQCVAGYAKANRSASVHRHECDGIPAEVIDWGSRVELERHSILLIFIEALTLRSFRLDHKSIPSRPALAGGAFLLRRPLRGAFLPQYESMSASRHHAPVRGLPFSINCPWTCCRAIWTRNILISVPPTGWISSPMEVSALK